ncbi:MAG: PAS domain S-box protein [Planctomycetes bacterium]|nr:PAS domain S-box protein [Planctomycetota bacterium]
MPAQEPTGGGLPATPFAQFSADYLPDPALGFAEAGQILHANGAACQVLGYSGEELLHMSLWDIDPTLTPQSWPEQWRRFQASGNLVRETRYRARDGHVLPVEVRFNYVAFGGRGYGCAVARDIHRYKQAEETLQASEVRFRNIVNALPLGMHRYELMEDDRLVFVGGNPAADRILHVSHASLIGKTIEEAFPGLVQTEVPARYRDTARNGVPWRTEQVEYHEGRIRGAFEVVAFQTEPGKMAAVFADITDRKRAAEVLRQSQEKYAKVFQSSPLALTVPRRDDGRVVEINDAMLKLLHYTREEMVGHTTPEVGIWAHPEDRADYIQKMARDGSVRGVEYPFRTREGKILTIQVFGESLEIGGEPHMLTTLVDVTERKQAQEEMRRLNEQLERQVAERTVDLRHTVDRLRQMTLELSQAEDRERKRIAGILHEDVQQMLAAARFHLSLLAGTNRNFEESRAILEQTRQLLREAIERSRNLSHELSPAMYQVDLMEILNWLARRMERQHGLVVGVKAHGPVDSPSEPLKALLYKVAQELLFNVVKHAGVQEASICVRRMGSNICLSVTDQGQGFDPRDLEEATGFGLLSVRERIGLLGGRMKIRSIPGVGSRILIAVRDQEVSGGVPS